MQWCIPNKMPELLREVLCSKNGPELYLKAVEKPKLYAYITYKNGADVGKSL